MQPKYNPKMANKGMQLESLIEYSNNQYKALGICNIQKVSTPWTVIRRGKQIVSAYPSRQSTLDFRGTVKGGYSISFDCKESNNTKGLPLANIKEHQINYIDYALRLNEISFIICEIKPLHKVFLIPGKTVVDYWQSWQFNKGKHGYNIIPISAMQEVPKSKRAIACDYLALFEKSNNHFIKCKNCAYYYGNDCKRIAIKKRLSTGQIIKYEDYHEPTDFCNLGKRRKSDIEIAKILISKLSNKEWE